MSTSKSWFLLTMRGLVLSYTSISLYGCQFGVPCNIALESPWVYIDPPTSNTGCTGTAVSDLLGADIYVKFICAHITYRPQKTIFESFDEAKLPWGVYFEEAPSNLLFKYTRRPESLEKFHPLFQFQEHARQGKQYHHLLWIWVWGFLTSKL